MAGNVVSKIDNAVQVRNVIVSVSNKAGLDQFIPALLEACPGVHFYSTGGTYSSIEKMLGAKTKSVLTQVSDYTGQPETQGGLVKTLDFKIYLGLLTEKYNDAHSADLKRTGAIHLNLVVVNLYPFRETIAKPGVTPEEARSNIDIGGPCMIRASAKNFIRVAPLVDPADYTKVVEECRKSGGKIGLKTRFELARKAFRHTANYDKAIAEYLEKIEFSSVKKTYQEIVEA